MALAPLDLAIVAAYLLGMIAVGWAVSRRIRGFADFFVAGRSLTTPVLICTLVSSYYGLDVLFGDAGDAAREGVVVWFAYMRPYTLFLLLAALLLARRLRAEQFLSVPDVLAHYYGRPAQVASALASFFYAMPILAIMGLAALAQVLFDVPLWLGAVGGAGIALVYTVLGGFWADALTDTVQFAIMCVSLAVAVPFALAAVGGFDGIEVSLGSGHFAMLGTAPPLYTLAYALTALSVLVEPAFYQRIFAARDGATVVRAFLIGIVIWAAYDWAVTAVGMAGGAMLADGRLPADTPPDQLLMRTMSVLLPLGLTGFFLGGCLAVAMSTVDSYLLIAAGNLVYDIYRPAARTERSDRELIRYTALDAGRRCGLHRDRPLLRAHQGRVELHGHDPDLDGAGSGPGRALLAARPRSARRDARVVGRARGGAALLRCHGDLGHAHRGPADRGGLARRRRDPARVRALLRPARLGRGLPGGRAPREAGVNPYDVASWIAVLILGPGALVILFAFLRDLRGLVRRNASRRPPDP